MLSPINSNSNLVTVPQPAPQPAAVARPRAQLPQTRAASLQPQPVSSNRQAMHSPKASAAAAAPESTNKELRRSILEQALKSQLRAKAAQAELEQQGELLRKSLDTGKRVAQGTEAAGEQLNQLVNEANEGPLRRLLRLWQGCCRCCCCCERREVGKREEGGPKADDRPAVAPNDHDEPEAAASEEVDMEWLKQAIAEGKNKRAAWRRTLAPSLEELRRQQSASLWHQQIDASLNQVQQVAGEIGSMLGEQMRLANLLTIYLDHGVDQALKASEQLVANKDKLQ